jgi:hypothetical protein
MAAGQMANPSWQVGKNLGALLSAAECWHNGDPHAGYFSAASTSCPMSAKRS